MNSFKQPYKNFNGVKQNQLKSIYYSNDLIGVKYKNKQQTPEETTQQTPTQLRLAKQRSQKDLFTNGKQKQLNRNSKNSLSGEKFLTNVKKQQNQNFIINSNIHKRNQHELKNFQYKNLNQKLFTIESKIAQMKKDLIEKRQQKKKLIKDQEQQRQRRQKERQQKKNQEQKMKMNNKNSDFFTEKKKITNQTNTPFIQKPSMKIIKKEEVQIPKLEIQQRFDKKNQKNISNGHQNKKSQSKINLKQLVTQVPEQKQFHTFKQSPYSPRSSIYYISQVIKAYKDQKSLAKQHIVQSLHYLKVLQSTKMPSMSQIQKRRLNLQRKAQYKNKKVLIFDLDQTLIHCNDSLSKKHDVKITINFPNNQNIQAGVNIRAGAKQILQKFYRQFQIFVFTASHSSYANEVIKLLDPEQKYIQHRLYRQHCYLSPEGMYIKDLRIINRSMADMILVDNAAYSYNFQLDNGVPILPFYHGEDFELMALQNYLRRILLANDIRVQNRKAFKLHRYGEYYNQPTKLVQDLYINDK